MSKASSITKAVVRHTAMAGLVWTTAASAAPPAAPAAQVTYSADARLARLDQLHAELEEAKLLSAIAKAKAEAVSPLLAGIPVAPGGGLTPPLPGAGATMPPLPAAPIRAATHHGAARIGPRWPALRLAEVTGNGNNASAMIETEAGTSLLVHIGSTIGNARVVAISADALTIRDPHGNSHTYN